MPALPALTPFLFLMQLLIQTTPRFKGKGAAARQVDSAIGYPRKKILGAKVKILYYVVVVYNAVKKVL